MERETDAQGQDSVDPSRGVNDLGTALQLFASGRLAACEVVCERLIRADPGHGLALTLLAQCAYRRGDYHQALAFSTRALRAGHGPAEEIVGGASSMVGLLPEAVGHLRRVFARDPHPRTEYNLALVLLAAGEWREGFERLEARWRKKGTPAWIKRWERMWAGEPLAGRTLLLHAEQGFGDAIQFSRYSLLAREFGSDVCLVVHRELVALLRSLAPDIRVLGPGDAIPPWDVHAPIMSLPRLLGVTPEDVRVPAPYLSAPAADLPPGGRRIGVVWAGNRSDPEDRSRSLPVSVLGELFTALDGATLFSLQLDGAQDLASCAGSGSVVDLSSRFRDFADTARAVQALDLVISVDTAVAHLAGALGRPVWLLLSAAPDWRWLRAGERTPWYGSMRLFRQRRLGDWSDVVGEVRRQWMAGVALR